MGLDTIAARARSEVLPPEDIIQAFGGYPEFRGKMYSDAVERITGQSLYQEWIPPSTVRSMLNSLEQVDRKSVV